MIRSAGSIERACELVGAALLWNHDVHVTIQQSSKGGRPTYTVHTVPRAPRASTEADAEAET